MQPIRGNLLYDEGDHVSWIYSRDKLSLLTMKLGTENYFE